MDITVAWDGITRRTKGYRAEVVAERDELSDAAYHGDWPTVFKLLDRRMSPNSTRIGGSSGYGVLHQAAWHGAEPAVVTELLAHGAWRTLRATDGLRPVDLAVRGSHTHLLELLEPIEVHPVPEAVLAGLERQLHALIMERADWLVTEHQLRLPQLAPLTELAKPEFHFPVPGMHGGFQIELHGRELAVQSWCRLVDGSEEKHRVTADRFELIAEGFANW